MQNETPENNKIIRELVKLITLSINRKAMNSRCKLIKMGVTKLALAILVILFLIPISTLSQEKKPSDSDECQENEWWSPILQKHNVVLCSYNNYENIFEMGTTNSINNRIVTLENAFFLLKETDDTYTIITSPLAYHDLDKNIIEGNDCTMETYSSKSKDTKPTEKFKCKYLKYDLISHKGIITDIEDPEKTKE